MSKTTGRMAARTHRFHSFFIADRMLTISEPSPRAPIEIRERVFQPPRRRSLAPTGKPRTRSKLWEPRTRSQPPSEAAGRGQAFGRPSFHPLEFRSFKEWPQDARNVAAPRRAPDSRFDALNLSAPGWNQHHVILYLCPGWRLDDAHDIGSRRRACGQSAGFHRLETEVEPRSRGA